MKKVKTWSEWLKDKYPKGTQVRLKYKRGNPALNGIFCHVEKVDDNGVIHAKSRGRDIQININTDEFELV